MAIDTWMETFAGRPVEDLDLNALPEAAGEAAWRLAYPDYEDTFTAPEDNDEEGHPLVTALMGWSDARRLKALVVGPWEDVEDLYDATPERFISALAQAAPRLPALEAIFLGDIPYEVNEISWIQQTDLAPLIMAFPGLKIFGARGGNGIRLGQLRHETLEHLELQAGGLPGEVVRDITSAHLPALKRLELWLGTEDYDGNVTVEDLQPILSGKLFPRLERLGLMNAQHADDIARALATAPVLDQLKALDLSMGILTDAGVEALLKHPALGRLEELNVSDNYLSDDLNQRLRERFPAMTLWIGSDKELEGNGRYVTHSE